MRKAMVFLAIIAVVLCGGSAFGFNEYYGKDWGKLSAKQKTVARMIVDNFSREFQETKAKLEQKGCSFKHGDLRITFRGNPQKGNLIVKLDVLIFEGAGPEDYWIFAVKKNWEKCPEPESAEIKEAVKFFIESVIYQIKLQPRETHF